MKQKLTLRRVLASAVAALAAAAAVWLLCRWVGYDLQLRIGNEPVYEIANDDYTQIIDVPEDGLWQAVPLEAGQTPAVQHPRGAVPRRYGHGRSV